MLSIQHLETQLRKVRCNYRFWGRQEILELGHIVMPDETILQCVNGRYAGGFALLCVTDRRVLLVDKKPLFLTVEDIRFDTIAEIDYRAHRTGASMRIVTSSRVLTFHSWDRHRLRTLLNYVQQQVIEIQQHFSKRHYAQIAADISRQVKSRHIAQESFAEMPQATLQRIEAPATLREFAPVPFHIAVLGVTLSALLLVAHLFGLRTLNPYFLGWAILWLTGLLATVAASASSFTVSKKVITQTYSPLLPDMYPDAGTHKMERHHATN